MDVAQPELLEFNVPVITLEPCRTVTTQSCRFPVGPAPAGNHFLSVSASAGRLHLLDGSRLVALSFAG